MSRSSRSAASRSSTRASCSQHWWRLARSLRARSGFIRCSHRNCRLCIKVRHNAFHWVQAAIIAGAAVALAQLVFDLWFWRAVPYSQIAALRHAAQLSAASPLSRLLFQALTDELMLRWGLMSGVLWVLALLFHQKSKPQPALVWTAIVSVAVMSALGQLPAILNMLSVDPASVLIARTAIVSAVAGIAYGWLYWKHGLEFAVLAHVLAQIGLIAIEGSALL